MVRRARADREHERHHNVRYLRREYGSALVDEAEYLCDRVAIVDSGKIVAMNTPDKLIDELVATGFERPKEVKQANLEDVFIHLTGKSLRED